MTKMYNSIIHEGGQVHFPEFNHERHYMIPFMQKEGLPNELQHWQRTVDEMLDGIETDHPIYFMADQQYIHAGLPHRRPGVHVDGYWVADIRAHGGGHRGSGIHRGYGVHRSRHEGSGGHRGRASAGDSEPWSVVDFSRPEAIILASDVKGARAWTGLYNESLIGEGGNADKVPVELLSGIDLKPNRAYIGTAGTLHASVPLRESAYRTMVRLNVPGISVN